LNQFKIKVHERASHFANKKLCWRSRAIQCAPGNALKSSRNCASFELHLKQIAPVEVEIRKFKPDAIVQVKFPWKPSSPVCSLISYIELVWFKSTIEILHRIHAFKCNLNQQGLAGDYDIVYCIYRLVGSLQSMFD
jgi:hypothetical protein